MRPPSKLVLGIPVLTAGLAAAVIGTGSPARAASVVNYVALGDSYSSGEGLAPFFSDGVERANAGQVFLHVFAFEKMFAGDAGILRNIAEITIGQLALRERTKGNAANAFLFQHGGEAFFNPALEHVVRRLVNQARRAELPQNRRRTPRLLWAII